MPWACNSNVAFARKSPTRQRKTPERAASVLFQDTELPVYRRAALARYHLHASRLALPAADFIGHQEIARLAEVSATGFLFTALPNMNSFNESVIAETRAWVNRAVIGLNLCPFAKAVQVKGLVRYVVSEANDGESLRADLREELQRLAEADPDKLETTLLVHPHVLTDFLDFSYFLPSATSVLRSLGLNGTLQIANFHPDYQFADTERDDVTNATNCSPYPTLHLLREDSIDRAVAAFPDPQAIYANNMRTLESLGKAGWAAVREQCRHDAEKGDAAVSIADVKKQDGQTGR